MGLFLNTLHVYADAGDTALCEKLAQLSLDGRYMERVDCAQDADLETRIVTSPGGRWITLVSDCLEEDFERTDKLQQDIAQKLNLPALTINCVDSDFVYLQLLEPDGGRLFAGTGRNYEGRMPIVEHPLRWKKYVSSVLRLFMAMAKKHVFAEECLKEAAPLLGMSEDQAICLMDVERASCEVRHYYYRFPNYDPDRDKPMLFYRRMPSCFTEGQNGLDVCNERESAKGLTVEFSGCAVDTGKVEIGRVTLRSEETGREEEIEAKRVTSPDGHALFLAEAPECPLPRMWDERLPQRAADKRCLHVTYTVNVPGGELLDAEYRMSVRVIPHKNPGGWCTRLMSMGTKERLQN